MIVHQQIQPEQTSQRDHDSYPAAEERPIRLEARKLSKSFGSVSALIDLDLAVPGGDALCLLGANGAGKTTTINLFLGFLEPTSGEAIVDGLDASKSPLDARKRLAYIPEQVALYPKLTGLENLQFFTELAGRNRSREELETFLAQAGLQSDAMGRRAETYSKGMRQKVGVAAALAKQAQVLLLDEPLSGLDPKAANDFCGLIDRMKARGCAILMATHDLFRAREVGSQVGIMKEGRLTGLLDASELQPAELESIYLEHMHGETGGPQ